MNIFTYFFLFTPLIIFTELEIKELKWSNFKTPQSVNKEFQSWKCTEEFVEAEKTAISLIDDFFVQDKLIKDFKKFKENINILLKELTKMFGNVLPEKIEEKIKDIDELVFSKYKEQKLKLDGLPINGTYSGLYYIFFENAIFKNFSNSTKVNVSQKRSLLIRYKIKLNDMYPYSSEDLSNVFFVLLNKNGFEVFRKFVGNIKRGNIITGSFEIDSENYDELRDVRFITDQDRSLI